MSEAQTNILVAADTLYRRGFHNTAQKLREAAEYLQSIERQHEELRAAAQEIDKHGITNPDFWDDNEVIEISVVLLKNLRKVLEEQKRGEG